MANEWAGVRRQVEQLVGRPVGDQLWIAVRKSHEYLGPDAAQPEDMAKDLEEIFAEAGESGTRERAERFAGRNAKAGRTQAISAVFAAIAAERADVRDFRARALPDGLVQLDDCAQWIFDHQPQSLPKKETALLDYAPPGAEWVHRVRVAHDSLLGDLQMLSNALAGTFSWQPQQATMFVLSGAVPIVAAIRGTVRYKGPVAAASRIILEIDPWTDPRDVQAAYSTLRKGDDATRRYRPLGERALALAAFIAERPDDPDEKRRRAWNRAHPDWTYPDVRSFSRAHRQAWERLLDPKIY